MKSVFKLALTVSIVIVLNQAATAQKKAATAQKAATANANAIYGEVKDNIYTNTVIGLRIQIPKEMEVDEPSFVDVALVPTQVPGSMFAGQTLSIKTLFSARAFPVMFICTATKLTPKLAKMTGEQILNDRLFREPTGPMAKVETLGTNTFAYVDGKTRFNENRSYAIVRKGYYLSIVVGYKDRGDLDVMRDYLAAADLDWKGP
jgi:hypothetical protein